jgi:hypothetical protein
MSTLSNVSYTNGVYTVSASSGTVTIQQPTTSQYIFSYDTQPKSYVVIGDSTSNLSVSIDESNLTITNATSNLFTTSNIAPYMQVGFNTITLNTLNKSLLVGINSNSIVRISNSNELLRAYDNSYIQITASNNVSFKNITYQPIAIVDTP